MPIRYSRAFDRERPGFGGRGGAVLAKPYRTRRLIVGNHGHDGIGTIGRIRRRSSPSRTAPDQIVGLRLAPIPYRDRKPGIEITAGHAVSHASEPTESYFCRGSVHILDRARPAAQGALRHSLRHELTE